MLKKILYQIHSLPHRRVFKSYTERDDLNQMIMGPPPEVIDGALEDYSGFGISNIKVYSNAQEAQRIVDSFNPDVFVTADFPKMVSTPAGCKKVYAGHGMMPGHILGLVSYDSNSRWNDFDLHCGATKRFEEFIHYVTRKKHEILTNALGQFDLVSNPKYHIPQEGNVLFNNSKPSILFCGFCCKDNSDFRLHNEDYFKMLLELEKLAKKHDWLVIVKPRQVIGKVINFLKHISWGSKYISVYPKLVSSEHLHFIDASANTYSYLSSDIIMCNGCSTLEIEACIAKKPLVIFRTQAGRDYDPYSTVSSGAASYIDNIEKTEGVIKKILSGEESRTNEQKKLIDSMNIKTDGLSYKRVQDRLKAL